MAHIYFINGTKIKLIGAIFHLILVHIFRDFRHVLAKIQFHIPIIEETASQA